MATSKKATPRRRTRQEISLLSVDEVCAELKAIGIRPVEFVTVDDDQFLLHTMPRLESFQRFDWAAFALIASDPFVTDYNKRNPPDDLPTIHQKQLYDFELKTYMDGLSLTQLKTQLKVVKVDDHFDRKPEEGWTVREFQAELQSRLRELEAITPKKNKRRTT